MFQTVHEISQNLIFVFVWKYVWKYVNINVSDIKKKKKKNGLQSCVLSHLANTEQETLSLETEVLTELE